QSGPDCLAAGTSGEQTKRLMDKLSDSHKIIDFGSLLITQIGKSPIWFAAYNQRKPLLRLSAKNELIRVSLKV
ncbi:MAG: hypothetical protein Q4E17_02535, partial [Synergistes sp.]|nr:hypothetical protein [Synergistes sp.]